MAATRARPTVMSRGRKRLGIVLLLAAAAGGGWWLWYSHRDYGAIFRHRQGQLLEVHPQKISRTARTTTYDLWLKSDTALFADARVRVPNTAGKYPAALLTVGLGTGKQVIDLIEETDDLVVMAVDYRWQEEFDVSSLSKARRTLARMREISDASVPRLLLAVDYLAREPMVAPRRISVIGVSYGSYYALPVAALDQRVHQAIIVQGGGAIGPTLTANAGDWRAPGPPRLWGAVGAVVFLPFQPDRWVVDIAPRRVTFIASRTDPTLPARAVEATYRRARQPKQLIWHDTPHVGPQAGDIIRELSRVVLVQLRKDGPS